MTINCGKYYERAVKLYRELHQVPELGFDLEETVRIVRSELEDCGISYTEKYGKGSIVAEIGGGERCIALRADMDALPIEEKSGLEFSSMHKGVMHACGHDSHTAILLSVARFLKENERKLGFRVRLIFQPSEECAESGAKMMVENGVMDGVDHIVATHCDPSIKAGEIGVCEGEYMAACVPTRITFFGRSSHATIPEKGIDAIAMANKAYAELKAAVINEAKGTKYIWSVGRFEGGSAHNIICDRCEMDISFRFYDMDLAARMKKETERICRGIANEYGGDVAIDWHMSTGPVINSGEIVKAFKNSAQGAGIKTNGIAAVMTSEDFGWYLTKADGCLFRYGTGDEDFGSVHPLHSCNFKIYEPSMKTAIAAFGEYLMKINKEYEE